ncbi:head-tail connector protein [Cereibacter changlensis]|nr:head-tail connector protein [Cereibacter changlensis]
MAIVDLSLLKLQLAFTDDMETVDDPLLDRQIQAAQNHIERMLGYKIEATFGGEGQEPIPPALEQAVLQLAAWWYEQRETAVVGSAAPVPFGVSEIVNEYREFSF